MGLKQCDKCSEMVDEAKAFCPGCGNPFVDEAKREVASSFDAFEGTVNLGNTMYNQMLSDMGLNISKAPNVPEKRVEVIAPEPAAVKPPVITPEKPKLTNNTKWFILGGVILVVGFMLIAAAALIYLYSQR